ncbi:hypothetical protein TNCV_2708421 [Trichonephila clavipes]|nr:hypothetical protein TNCV_2708421 [Trichonephila clavipes]
MLTTPLQTGSTMLSGQCAHTDRSERAYSPPPLKRLATVFRETLGSCFPEAPETDLSPAELWCAAQLIGHISVF